MASKTETSPSNNDNRINRDVSVSPLQAALLLFSVIDWQAGGMRPTDLCCTDHQHGQDRISVMECNNTPLV